MEKKKIFGITFDPAMQPGFQTRFKSMSSLEGKKMRVPVATNLSGGIFVNDDLRLKYKSALVEQTLPSQKLRKAGKY